MTTSAVLGGGALGLTVALRLAQRGDDVVLFERESRPGGLAAGFPLGHSYLEKFYHHLFRSDTSAIALITELGLQDKLLWPRPKTALLIDGKPRQLDSVGTVLRFEPLPFLDRLRLGAATAYLRLEPDYHRLERSTADAWLRRWMGSRVYETVWRPQLQAKFGERFDEIVMAWMWARLHFRSTSLGYLRGGFQQLYDALVARIEELGGRVHFGTTVEGIHRSGEEGLCVVTSSGEYQLHRVVSTLPTRLTINLTSELQGQFAEQFGRLDSYGAHSVILTLTQPLTDIYWLSINDPGYPFLALVEHTNYMPRSDYDGRHIVYLGNYLPMQHPLFSRPEDEVVEEFIPSLRRINPDFRPEWVTEHRMFKAPFAQPIVTMGYAARLPGHVTPVPNLYLANMSQVYPQDRGQNYSIAMANRLVASLS